MPQLARGITFESGHKAPPTFRAAVSRFSLRRKKGRRRKSPPSVTHLCRKGSEPQRRAEVDRVVGERRVAGLQLPVGRGARAVDGDRNGQGGGEFLVGVADA